MHRKVISFFFNKYLIISLLVLGFFFNFFLIYLAICIFFLKKFLKKKKLIFLIFFYSCLSLILFDFWKFKTLTKNKYQIKSNIAYNINKKFGYFPKENKIFKEEIFLNKSKIDEISYSINKFGHRVTGETKLNTKKCVFFHGGSFTFGQMVNDQETLPYVFNINSGYKYKVFNLAFNGYGAHQFLAKLEVKYLEDYESCKETTIIYQFIPDHIGRSAGRRSWGDKSPRYIFENNELVDKGFFSNYPFKIFMKIRKNFRNSKIISNLIYNPEIDTVSEQNIFVKILQKTELLSKQIFNNVNFIYIVWDYDKIKNKNLKNFFNTSNIILVNNLKIDNDRIRNKYDEHPSKYLNYELSKIILKKIKSVE